MTRKNWRRPVIPRSCWPIVVRWIELLEKTFDAMQRACNQGDESVLRNMLIELVPEHTGLAV
jgi:hypothetical protein